MPGPFRDHMHAHLRKLPKQDLGSEGVVKKMRELSGVLDVNIFAYEYTGYGMSTGEPSEEAGLPSLAL